MKIHTLLNNSDMKHMGQAGDKMAPTALVCYNANKMKTFTWLTKKNQQDWSVFHVKKEIKANALHYSNSLQHFAWEP